VSTTQAHRVNKARRLIADAYGLDAQELRQRVLRVDLLGDSVAAARVRIEGSAIPAIWLARRQESGRAVRLLRENREVFASVKAMFSYLEALYARYGGPNGEPPGGDDDAGARRGLRLMR
jgi:hypothetical protein